LFASDDSVWRGSVGSNTKARIAHEGLREIEWLPTGNPDSTKIHYATQVTNTKSRNGEISSWTTDLNVT
jgi:hypothetical protein